MTTNETTPKTLELKCPSCSTKIYWSKDFPYRPFCSKRCQQVDFGDWAFEKNRVAGDDNYDDLLSGDLEDGEF